MNTGRLAALLLLLILSGACSAWAYRLAVGSYVVGATASDNRNIVISPPFTPIAVMVKCTATQPVIWYIAGMGADNAVSIGSTVIGTSNRIQQLNADGFQVGTDASVQSLNVTCYYAAFGDNGRGDIAVNTYPANDIDGFDVNITPAFLPDFVMIKNYAGTGANPVWRTGSHAGDLTSHYPAAASQANLIQVLQSTGFEIGGSTIVNGTPRDYAYMAIKSVPGYNESNTFTGNTSDLREIPSINTPLFAVVKPISATNPTAQRFGTTGDLSWGMSQTPTTDIIQNFSTTGFQIGTSSFANENTVLTHYWVSKDPHYRSKVRSSR